ncbi:MAG: plasmid mobilization relaxosome protein MobC [Clostridiales bacterium]|nr:plasmid mobilization relaxosome protein MobC [Clostridiales bacterium]
MVDANRTKALLVRLTHEEKELLKEQSARTGRTQSDIIRSAWKKLKIIELPPADFAETVVQLRRIGNNLNQVARAVNMGEVHIPEIKNVLSEIVAIDKKLSKILLGGGRKWL